MRNRGLDIRISELIDMVGTLHVRLQTCAAAPKGMTWTLPLPSPYQERGPSDNGSYRNTFLATANWRIKMLLAKG